MSLFYVTQFLFTETGDHLDLWSLTFIMTIY